MNQNTTQEPDTVHMFVTITENLFRRRKTKFNLVSVPGLLIRPIGSLPCSTRFKPQVNKNDPTDPSSRFTKQTKP